MNLLTNLFKLLKKPVFFVPLPKSYLFCTVSEPHMDQMAHRSLLPQAQNLVGLGDSPYPNKLLLLGEAYFLLASYAR